MLDDEGDVRMFLFYFENIFMRGMDKAEKAMKFLSLMDGERFRFTLIDLQKTKPLPQKEMFLKQSKRLF